MLADWNIKDFSVAGFWAALLFSIVLSLITALFGILTKGK
jgi:uncharacterized membrane protein YvlD (DUF360 family)